MKNDIEKGKLFAMDKEMKKKRLIEKRSKAAPKREIKWELKAKEKAGI